MKTRSFYSLLSALIAVFLMQCSEPPKKDPVKKTGPGPIPDPEMVSTNVEFQKTHIAAFLDSRVKTLFVLPDMKDAVLKYLGANPAGKDSFSLSAEVDSVPMLVKFGIGGVTGGREELFLKAAIPSVIDTIKDKFGFSVIKVFNNAMCQKVQDFKEECKASGDGSIRIRRFQLSQCLEGTDLCSEFGGAVINTIESFDTLNCRGNSIRYKAYTGFSCR